MVTTLSPLQPTEQVRAKNRQGRSKKTLRTVIRHDGIVFVARYDGRPAKFFGKTLHEAQNNLHVGGQ